MNPVEIEFLMKDKLSGGLDKATGKAETLVNKSKEVSDAISQRLEEQKRLVSDTTKRLEELERKLQEMKPGTAQQELTDTVRMCREELERQKDSLSELETEFDDAVSTLNEFNSLQDRSAASGRKLSSELSEIQNMMARMRLEGKENSDEYRELSEQAARLTSVLSDMRKETKELSDDGRTFSGILSGLSGASGAITTLTGIMSLFTSENENLTRIQTRLQSVMATTMGLQQVYNTLNKNSAFSVVTLTRAKNLLTTANARLAAALRISNTQAQILIGTLTMGLSVAVGAAIWAWNKYSQAQEKAAEKAREMVEVESEGRAQMIKTRFEIDTTIATLKDFNGSKEEEKKKVADLNAKYGEAFGYYNSLAEWYDTLTEKSAAYIQMLFEQAKAQALVNKAVEIDAQINEVNAQPASSYDTWWGYGGKIDRFFSSDKSYKSRNNGVWKKQEKLDVLNKQRQELLDSALEEYRKSLETARNAGIGGHVKQDTGPKEEKKTNDDLMSLRRDNLQKEIDLLKEGSYKRRRQIQENYENELADLEVLEKKWLDAQKGALTAEQKAALKSARDLAANKRDAGYEDIAKEEQQAEKERLEAARQSWNEYLTEYGTYEEKRRSLTEKYTGLIHEAQTLGERESLRRQLDEQLRSLNFEEFRNSINFADVFADIDLMSTDSLNKLKEQLKQYINGAAAQLKPNDLKQLQDALKNIDLKLDERHPFVSFRKDMDEYRKAQKEVAQAQEDLNTVTSGGTVITGAYIDANGKIVNRLMTVEQAERKLSQAQTRRQSAMRDAAKSALSVAGQMTQIADAAGKVANVLEQDFGMKLDENLENAVEGFSEMSSGIESLSQSILSGNIAGAVAGIVQTIGGQIRMLGSLLGTDWGGERSTRRYEQAKAQYESYISVLDQVIDKQKELVASMKASDYLNAGNSYEYAKALTQKQEETARILGRQYLESGSSKGFAGIGSSSSAGAKQRKAISQEAWNEYNALKRNTEMLRQLGITASELTDAAEGRMTGLFDLSAKQLEWIMEQAPTFWAQLHDDTRAYLNQIIACADAWEDIQAVRQENLTKITFDDFYANWQETILSMDNDWKKLSSNMEDNLRESILKSMIEDKYKDRVRALYDSWSDMAASDGEVTDREIDALRAQRDALAKEMMDERDRIARIYGWDNSSVTQTGRTSAIQAMTYDQGTKLEGLFVSGQMHWASIDGHVGNIASEITGVMSIFRDIRDNTKGSKDTLDNIKELMDIIRRDGLKMQ